MTAQPHPDSYYVASANALIEHPSLQGIERCDVCIVGAGITGLSAALALARRGYRVIVLEAERVGFGASGRSGGQAIFGWACEQATLERLVGEENAREFWKIALEGLALVKQQIETYQIDCDWCDGMVHLGLKSRHDRELADWFVQLTEHYRYRSLEFWSKEQVREQIDSSLYTSGLYDANSGHLHPLNYTLGLAKAAQQAGVTLHEGSRVVNLSQGRQPFIQTAQGEVRADHVLLAGNAYLDGLEPLLQNRLMPVGTYIIATEPLVPELAASLMKNRLAACDMNFVLDYFRLSADHRLLFGGRVSYSGREPDNLKALMRARMVQVFPQLADVAIDYCWGGYVGITRNRAPHFGRLSNNVLFAQGFSGHGIAATNIAGQLMAEAIATTSERFDLFNTLHHKSFPGGQLLRTPALVLAMAYYRLRDRL